MGKKKARPVYCLSCEYVHDLNLGGWVVLASGELICDPVNRPECWEKVAEQHAKKKGLTNANKKVR